MVNIFGGDVLANRMRKDLAERIEKETEAFVKTSADPKAAHIRGLMDALSLIEGAQNDYTYPERKVG